MKQIKGEPNDYQAPFPIAVIVSQFNHDITNELLQGVLKRLTAYGFTTNDITVVTVPGAVEIPLVAKLLAKKKQYGAIIALGAVIRGETSHYDYVCQQVSEGCQRITLEFETPVVFGVLTTENEAQAWERLGGTHGHKGVDAADCALSMYAILKQL
jgi:6,7-dimethyl-8-ribityllumazine synthase